MISDELLVSSVNITEDDYDYKGLFILSSTNKSLNLNMADMDDNNKINEIRLYFNLSESNSEIRNNIMKKVFEKSTISSRFVQGENYNKD